MTVEQLIWLFKQRIEYLREELRCPQPEHLIEILEELNILKTALTYISAAEKTFATCAAQRNAIG